jgi:hypothetical protein
MVYLGKNAIQSLWMGSHPKAQSGDRVIRGGDVETFMCAPQISLERQTQRICDLMNKMVSSVSFYRNTELVLRPLLSGSDVRESTIPHSYGSSHSRAYGNAGQPTFMLLAEALEKRGPLTGRYFGIVRARLGRALTGPSLAPLLLGELCTPMVLCVCHTQVVPVRTLLFSRLPARCYTAKGYVSGNSPASHSEFRSKGSTARV